MIYTVARILGPIEFSFDHTTAELGIRYQKPHRATAGKVFEVVLEAAALRELLHEIRRLEALPDSPLGKLVEK